MKHTNFFSALKSAICGVKAFFIESRNARIQFFLFLLALTGGFYFQINSHEWLWLGVSACMVFCLEAVNTSIEFLADLISTDYHPLIKKLKDISAGAVLIASIFSLMVGIVIFWPHLSAILLH